MPEKDVPQGSVSYQEERVLATHQVRLWSPNPPRFVFLSQPLAANGTLLHRARLEQRARRASCISADASLMSLHL